jgi:membrane fusion protein (multidrug efflux system)
MKHQIVAFALLGGVVVSCSSKQKETTLESYPITSPVLIDTNSYVDYVAEIKAVQNVEIRSKIAGFLEKIHVDEGAVVQAGQLLFSIDNREYKEQLTKKRALLKLAQADLKSSELELENTRNLVEKKVVSKIELEFARNKLAANRAKVEEAAAEVEHAKLILSYTKVCAPFSGLIDRLPNKIGSLVAEGTLMTTISQNEEVFAYFDVSEKEYLDLMSQVTKGGKAQREVKLMLANGEEHTSSGLIETMDGQIDESTGNLAFRARFANTEKLLKHGASGKVRIAKHFKKAMIIPQKATFEIQDRTFVYVVNKMGKVAVRQITISNRIPHLFIISSGLSLHDKFIYEGIQSVDDGTIIQPSFVPMKQIINELSKF